MPGGVVTEERLPDVLVEPLRASGVRLDVRLIDLADPAIVVCLVRSIDQELAHPIANYPFLQIPGLGTQNMGLLWDDRVLFMMPHLSQVATWSAGWSRPRPTAGTA